MPDEKHEPVDWFLPGVYPSCTCGYAPKNNRALNQHWHDHGIRWWDDHGRLCSEAVTP